MKIGFKRSNTVGFSDDPFDLLLVGTVKVERGVGWRRRKAEQIVSGRAAVFGARRLINRRNVQLERTHVPQFKVNFKLFCDHFVLFRMESQICIFVRFEIS